MMKNSPHDAAQLCMPNPTDHTGKPLTYPELVMAMRSVLQIPAAPVTEMELEEMV